MGNPTLLRLITGEIFIWEKTGLNGPEPDVQAQFGFGPAGDDPANEFVDLTTWSHWQDAEYYSTGIWAEDNSRYKVNFLPEMPGRFYYTFRFSTTGGREWVYPDKDKTVHDPTSVIGSSLSLMIVNRNLLDTEPPDSPTLSVTSITATTVDLAWTTSASSDVYAYDVYRSSNAGELGQLIKGSRRLAGQPTQFTDDQLVSSTFYYYSIVALDTSFNATQSNQVEARTLDSLVTFTLNVSIPTVTPGQVYINRAFDPDKYEFGEIDWRGIPLSCDKTARRCSVILTIKENSRLNFYFSRGSQDTVQTQVDGNSPAIDPSFRVTKGMTIVNRSIANWDDPLVTSYTPISGNISPYTNISVTWNQIMPPSTNFVVYDLGNSGAIPGNVVEGDFYFDPDNNVLTFDPKLMLAAANHYQVVVKEQTDSKFPAVSQQVETIWNFTTDNLYKYLPFVHR
jgi:hypothetical protein